MNQYATIDPRQFVEAVREPLEQHDCQGLARKLHQLWSDEQIIALLDSGHQDARKLAALALGYVGDLRCVTPLANCLKDRDPIVNQMAEHALWTVWFRSGAKPAQEAVQRGTALLNKHNHQAALQEFALATRLDPTYAEAFNQRSITFYLLEDFHAAIDEAATVVKLMPQHFGAWAGMGHCHAHNGDARRAIECYRRALGINPHLYAIREILEEIESGQCTLQ